MPRVVVDDEEHKRRRNAAKLSALLKPKVTRRRASGAASTPAKVAKVLAETEAKIESGDWTTATHEHIVGLYLWGHEAVYGVSVLEEIVPAYRGAVQAAKTLVGRVDGSIPDAVEFMRWVWKREESREAWRREHVGSGKRLSWKAVFSHSIFNDYRADLLRRGAGR